MIPGQQIVQRIIRGDPGAKPATLLSRVFNSSGTDTYASYGWTVTDTPTNKNLVASQNVQGANETTTFRMLREGQAVEPKFEDRLTVAGVTWTIRQIVDIRWERNAFDCFCVADPI